MRLDQLLIALAIFGLFITVGYNLFLDQSINNGVGNAGVFEEDLLNITAAGDLNDLTEEVRSDTQSPDIDVEDTESSLYKSSIPSVLSVYEAGELAQKTAQRAAIDTGLIPPYVVDVFKWILAILAGMFVIYMLFRFKPQN